MLLYLMQQHYTQLFLMLSNLSFNPLLQSGTEYFMLSLTHVKVSVFI